MLTEAYGDETLTRVRVFDWHKWFLEGKDSMEDEERVGHPRSAMGSQWSDCYSALLH